MSLLDGALRLQEPLDQILGRYDQIAQLIDRALVAIADGDRETALIVAAGVVAKTHVLDGRLGLINVRDGGGSGRPPGLFTREPGSSSRSSRRRRSA